MTRARFLEVAQAELEEAVRYFDQQLAGLGRRFEREAQSAVSLVAGHPRIGSPLTKRLRKFRLRTFHYNLIYVTEGEEVLVVAVAHHKRRPGYWRRRLTRTP